jgi:uncharacterized membrane protein
MAKVPEAADPSSPRGFPDFPASPARLESVDLLRGLVMVLMALDHTRDFFTELPFDPTDLEQTHPALFITRWITHFCAPVFIFLAGTSAFLSTTRGKTPRALSWFLFTRGLWLVLLELFYVNWFGWRFHINLHSYGVQVIWAIGWSMVALAVLVRLPRGFILVFGLAMIVLHNMFDDVKPESFGALAGLWRVLHAGGQFEIAPGINFFAGYPLIPWIGVMAVGYAFGPVLLRDPASRGRWLVVLGALLTATFVMLRTTNLYGDPRPWAPQKNLLFTLFSFVNCTKYPPSLCYLLMTLGPALLVLALLDRGTPRLLKPLLAFGRVPLFFYLVHLPLIHGLLLLSRSIRFHGAPPPDIELGLPGIYLMWLVAVALLYPICWAFSEIKRRYRAAWLGYL